MRTVKEILPKEHGTWAMLLAPWMVGAGVARRLDGWALLLLTSMLFAFLAQHQVAAWLRAVRAPAPGPLSVARRRALVLLALATASGVPLVLRLGAALVGLGGVASTLAAAGLVLVHRRIERALPGQILAALGLPVSAAAAHAVAVGRVTTAGLELWALSALFFLGAVVHVRVKITAIPRARHLAALSARLAFAWPALALETLIAALAVTLALVGPLSPLVALAFAPVAVQAIVGTLTLHRRASLKRVGILSTLHAIAFAAIVIALA